MEKITSYSLDPVKSAARWQLFSASIMIWSSWLALDEFIDTRIEWDVALVALLVAIVTLPFCYLYAWNLRLLGQFPNLFKDFNLELMEPSPSNQAAIRRLEQLNQLLRSICSWLLRGIGLLYMFGWAVAPVTAGAGAALALPIGAILFILGSRLGARSATRLLEQSRRDGHVLYLRPFDIDDANESTQEKTRWWRPKSILQSHEEPVLSEIFSLSGEFVAVGQPDEPLPHLGASRMYIKHDNWKEEVQSLITDASLVVMRVGTSPGFMWEVQQVLQHQKPENVLLYFSSSLTPMELDDLYGSFQAITRNVFPVELPQNLEGHRFIRFEESWKPVVFGNMEYTVRSENFLVPRAIRNVFYNNKLQHRLGMALRPFFERQGISVNKGRIFGDLSIALGMYCGGPLIAGFMMARNLSVAEQKHAARIVLSISLLLCLAALTLSHLPSIVGILLQTNQWRAPDFISGTHFVLAVALFYAWRHFPDERVRNQVILGNPRVPAWLIVPLLALVFFVWQILLLTPWTEILDVFKGSFWAT